MNKLMMIKLDLIFSFYHCLLLF